MISTKITLQRMENQMVGTKITRPRVGQYKNNPPKGWVAQKITRQRDGRKESKMVSTKVTPQRMESQMVGTKITCSRVGQYKNNSHKGWVAQNNSPKGWTDGELNGQHKNNLAKGWRIK